MVIAGPVFMDEVVSVAAFAFRVAVLARTRARATASAQFPALEEQYAQGQGNHCVEHAVAYG